ncbi:hypothetical protein ABBQ38_012483 [Trebouxia sp. C0009 RCD-2024]
MARGAFNKRRLLRQEAAVWRGLTCDPVVALLELQGSSHRSLFARKARRIATVDEMLKEAHNTFCDQRSRELQQARRGSQEEKEELQDQVNSLREEVARKDQQLDVIQLQMRRLPKCLLYSCSAYVSLVEQEQAFLRRLFGAAT